MLFNIFNSFLLVIGASSGGAAEEVTLALVFDSAENSMYLAVV